MADSLPYGLRIRCVSVFVQRQSATSSRLGWKRNGEWTMQKLMVLGLGMMLLTGCTEVRSSVVPVCPSLVEYSTERQRQAEQELRALPRSAVVPGMMADYGRLRDQVRAGCNGPAR